MARLAGVLFHRSSSPPVVHAGGQQVHRVVVSEISAEEQVNQDVENGACSVQFGLRILYFTELLREVRPAVHIQGEGRGCESMHAFCFVVEKPSREGGGGGELIKDLLTFIVLAEA